MAAKHAGLDFDEFNSWSAQAGNYGGESATRSTWRSLKATGGITESTLFAVATAAGWHEDAPSISFKRSSRDPSPARVHAPAWPVLEAWSECVPATGDHPYIRRKAGMPDGLRVYPHGAQPRGWAGRDDVRGWLVIPAFDQTGELKTLQFVAAGGDKINLQGLPVDGWFTLGEVKPGASGVRH